jgi:hypothetical protein
MFTHPALLREMTLLADFLRRSGAGEWSRIVVQTADSVRKTGWTDEGHKRVQSLFSGDTGLHQVSFGVEHHRQVGGEAGAAKANARLERFRMKLSELAAQPTVAAVQGPRPKSPDLI